MTYRFWPNIPGGGVSDLTKISNIPTWHLARAMIYPEVQKWHSYLIAAFSFLDPL